MVCQLLVVEAMSGVRSLGFDGLLPVVTANGKIVIVRALAYVLQFITGLSEDGESSDLGHRCCAISCDG